MQCATLTFALSLKAAQGDEKFPYFYCKEITTSSREKFVNKSIAISELIFFYILVLFKFQFENVSLFEFHNIILLLWLWHNYHFSDTHPTQLHVIDICSRSIYSSTNLTHSNFNFLLAGKCLKVCPHVINVISYCEGAHRLDKV